MHITAQNPMAARREDVPADVIAQGKGDRQGADWPTTRRTPTSRPTSSRRSPRARSRPGSPRTSSVEQPFVKDDGQDSRRVTARPGPEAGHVRPLQGRREVTPIACGFALPARPQATPFAPLAPSHPSISTRPSPILPLVR